MVLQSNDKLMQAPVVGCHLVPETSVSGIRHHSNLSVPDASHLLLNDRRSDNGIIGAMCNQYRLSNFRQMSPLSNARENSA
jgi:hypothetical protein